MHETKECSIVKEGKVNRTPQGFEYHWPKEEYSKIYNIQNWYVNFETMTMYIDGTKLTYEVLLNEHSLEVAGTIHNERSWKTIYNAYVEYMTEVILLG